MSTECFLLQGGAGEATGCDFDRKPVWSRDVCSGEGLPGGDGFLEIGDWRVGNVDGEHFSISHKDGITAMVFRDDGNQLPGPRQDYGLWDRTGGECATGF